MTDGSGRPGITKGGVLICHSAGQRHYEQHLAEWWPVPRALAESGRYICLACDLGDPMATFGPTSAGYSWGNENSLERMSDAYRFLMGPKVRARAGPILLVGTSMGALTALNWVLRHRELVAGIILGCPVLDIEALYGSNAGGLSASIAQAHGVSWPAELPDLSSHCPTLYAAALSALPMRIYASSNDPIASNTGRCLEFAAGIPDSLIEVVDLGPVGHSPTDTPVNDALSFAASVL